MEDYIQKYQLEDVLSEVLNDCVKSRSDNPFGFMAKALFQKTPSVILNVHAGYLIEHPGGPTTYVDIRTHKGVFRGIFPRASNPSIHELPELRDLDTRFHGKGVMQAVFTINEKIAPLLIGKDPRNQADIDRLLRVKTKYTNVMYPISVAVCKAGAKEHDMSVAEYIAHLLHSEPMSPVVHVRPLFRSGHLELYLGASGEECTRKMYETAESFTPDGSSETDLLIAATRAIEDTGHTGDVWIGIHMNASERITETNSYTVSDQMWSREQLIDLYTQWADEFPLMFIEDPFDQDDPMSFTALKNAMDSCMVIGTNLYASCPKRVTGPWTHVLTLKPSASGTVSLALECVQRAKEHDMHLLVSDRSTAFTPDEFDADFAVGAGARFLRQKFHL